MQIPSNCKYTKEHIWVRQEEIKVTIGITDHAQELLGEISFIELPVIRTILRKDEKLATIESLKAILDLMCPVNGTVIDVNNKLKEEPGLINKDPYVKGWIVRIELKDSSEIVAFMTNKEYSSFISESI